MFKAFAKNFKMAKYVMKLCPVYVVCSIIYIIAAVINAVVPVFLIRLATQMFTDGNTQISEILLLMGVYLIIVIVMSGIGLFYNGWLSQRYRVIFQYSIQYQMFNKSRDVDYADFDNPEFYASYNRALNDGSWRGFNIYNSLVNFVRTVVTIIAMGVVIVLSDYILLIIAAVSAVSTVLIRMIINKMNYNVWKKNQENYRMTWYINRVFYQQKYAAELKSTPVNDILIDEVKKHNKIINKASMKNDAFVGVLNSIISFIQVVLKEGGIYIYLAYCLLSGNMLLAVFTSMITASLSFTDTFTNMLQIFVQIQEDALYTADFLSYMEYKPKVEHSGKVSINGAFEKLEIKNVTFAYPSNEYNSLVDVDLTIKKGDKLAIVGLNGAGKTTLIKLLLKFYNPTKGEIFYNNQSYLDLKENEIRKEFSIIFQDFQIYSTSIAENVLMRECKNEEDEKLVLDCLDKVGLKDKILDFDEGINTLVTRELADSGAVFSGGEKQRLVIARVFASNSAIYILDEPTASLDPLAEAQINSLIMEKANDKTIIVIAHRLSTVVDADRIILIEDGRIIEDGTHEQLMLLNGKYCTMFTVQAAMYKDFSEIEIEEYKETIHKQSIDERRSERRRGLLRGRWW